MAPGDSLCLRLHETRTRTVTVLAKILPQLQRLDAHQPHYKKRIVNGVMSALGLEVLVLHLAADAVGRNGTDPGYLLGMTPLGSTQYLCAVFEVSCTQKHIARSKSELEHALHNIDPLGVQGLVFSHCEALSIPPRLRDFSNLIEIKIHNCSLAEWGDDAAVIAQAHPVLQSLYIRMINMSKIPRNFCRQTSRRP